MGSGLKFQPIAIHLVSLAKEETALVPADPPGPPARHLVCPWYTQQVGPIYNWSFFGPMETRVGEWIEVAEVPMEAPEQGMPGMPQEMMLAIHRIFLDFAQALHDDHKWHIYWALKQQPDPQNSCTSTIQLQEGAEASEGQDAETNGRHPSSEWKHGLCASGCNHFRTIWAVDFNLPVYTVAHDRLSSFVVHLGNFSNVFPVCCCAAQVAPRQPSPASARSSLSEVCQWFVSCVCQNLSTGFCPRMGNHPISHWVCGGGTLFMDAPTCFSFWICWNSCSVALFSGRSEEKGLLFDCNDVELRPILSVLFSYNTKDEESHRPNTKHPPKWSPKPCFLGCVSH